MSTWTAQIGGTEKTFAEWGISGARISRISLAADEFTFGAPALAFDADPVFAYGDQVTIRQDGVVQFVGKVIEIPLRAAAAIEGQGYRVANAWADLDRLVYQQTWYLQVDPEHPSDSLVGGYQSRIVIFQGINGLKLTMAAQLQDIINYAVVCGIAIQLASDVATNLTAQPPFDEALDITCAEAIRRVLRWAPDAVSWVDYTTTPPTLHVAKRSQLEAAAVPYSVAPVTDLQITARHDLVTPVVVLKFARLHTVDGSAWRELVRDIYPLDGTEQTIGALIATIDLEGASVRHSFATIVCRPFQPDTQDWWASREGTMRDANVTVTGFDTQFTIIDEHGDHVGPLFPDADQTYLEWTYEVVKGQIAPWMLTGGATAASITVQTTLDYTFEKLGAIASITARGVVEKPLTARVTVTSLPSGTYSTVSESSPAEDIPVGLAEEVFGAVGELHYQGSITLTGEEAPHLASLGQVLNLTGGRSEWATARALIQSMVEDIDSGTLAIQFGPPNHLGPADLVELLRFNRQRRVTIASAGRVSGRNSDAEAGSLGDVTANNDSSLTDGGVPASLSLAEYGGVNPETRPDLQDIARSIKLDPTQLQIISAPANVAQFRKVQVTLAEGGVDDGPRTMMVLGQLLP